MESLFFLSTSNKQIGKKKRNRRENNRAQKFRKKRLNQGEKKVFSSEMNMFIVGKKEFSH